MVTNQVDAIYSRGFNSSDHSTKILEKNYTSRNPDTSQPRQRTTWEGTEEHRSIKYKTLNLPCLCNHQISGGTGLVSGDEALEATADVTLAGGNFEVSVDNPGYQLDKESCKRNLDRKTYVTARRIPVPLPRAPRRSEATERAPMQAPPKAAAVGMTRFSSLYMLCSR